MPVQPADAINYVFGFVDAGAASRDAVVGPLNGSEVLLFGLGGNSVTPMGGWQTLVVQWGGTAAALLEHPNLLLAYDLSLLTRDAENPVIATVFTAQQLAQLSIVLSNISLIIRQGLLTPPALLVSEAGVQQTDEAGPLLTA